MKRLKCHKCGNEKEFYVKESFKGRCSCFFRTDGREADNSDMYRNATHSLISKFIYCAECNARVKKLSPDEEVSDYEGGVCDE